MQVNTSEPGTNGMDKAIRQPATSSGVEQEIRVAFADWPMPQRDSDAVQDWEAEPFLALRWDEIIQLTDRTMFAYNLLDEHDLVYYFPGLMLKVLPDPWRDGECDSIMKLARQAYVGEDPFQGVFNSMQREAIKSFRRCVKCQVIVEFYGEHLWDVFPNAPFQDE